MNFCDACGTRLTAESRFCPQCGVQVNRTEQIQRRSENAVPEQIGEAVPPRPGRLVRHTSLPSTLESHLSDQQRHALAFAAGDFAAIGANTQAYQLGSSSLGAIIGGGFDRSLGSTWGMFGGVGAVNQSTVNKYRTDVHLRLRATDGSVTFVAGVVPFELTVSIDPNDQITIFFVKGGFPKPFHSSDFYAEQWLPFAAVNRSTGQVIPLGPIPSLARPTEPNLGCGLPLIFFGLIFVMVTFQGTSDAGQGTSDAGTIAVGIIVAGVLLVGGFNLIPWRLIKYSAWKREVERAKSNVPVSL